MFHLSGLGPGLIIKRVLVKGTLLLVWDWWARKHINSMHSHVFVHMSPWYAGSGFPKILIPSQSQTERIMSLTTIDSKDAMIHTTHDAIYLKI